MAFTDYLKRLAEGKFDRKWFTYKNVDVNLNMKNKKIQSHVEDRLSDRSKLSPDEFKAKLKKAIDDILEKHRQDALTWANFLIVFKKSGIKILCKFNEKRKGNDDLYLITILDMDMEERDIQGKITLNEDYIQYIFDVHEKNLKENEFDYDEIGEHNSIVFLNEKGKLRVEGYEIFEYDL